MVRGMPFQLLPLVVVLLAQLAGAAADPFMRDLPAFAYAVPERAPDEVGTATTYGRARDSHRQAFMAAAEHVRLDDTMHVCAHRSPMRFGTVLLLQHVGTGRTTMCRVMDRGPFGCRDPETGERFNGAREPARACIHGGFLDMAPAVRAALAPGDGGRQLIRAWVLSRPARPTYVRRPTS